MTTCAYATCNGVTTDPQALGTAAQEAMVVAFASLANAWAATGIEPHAETLLPFTGAKI